MGPSTQEKRVDYSTVLEFDFSLLDDFGLLELKETLHRIFAERGGLAYPEDKIKFKRLRFFYPGHEVELDSLSKEDFEALCVTVNNEFDYRYKAIHSAVAASAAS